MNILKLPERKRKQDKIVMVTCYDYTSARIVEQSDPPQHRVRHGTAGVGQYSHQPCAAFQCQRHGVLHTDP